jgi:hypothetical protein
MEQIDGPVLAPAAFDDHFRAQVGNLTATHAAELRADLGATATDQLLHEAEVVGPAPLHQPSHRRSP